MPRKKSKAYPAHYDLLEVHARARESIIKAAYRALANELHPDKGGDPAAFKRLNDGFK